MYRTSAGLWSEEPGDLVSWQPQCNGFSKKAGMVIALLKVSSVIEPVLRGG